MRKTEKNFDLFVGHLNVHIKFKSTSVKIFVLNFVCFRRYLYSTTTLLNTLRGVDKLVANAPEEDSFEQAEIFEQIDCVLDLLFYAGVKNEIWNTEEKKEIGKHLGNLFDRILVNLRGVKSDNRLSSRLFRKRSVIEFMVGLFGDIEVKNKPLRDLLYENDIRKIREHINSRIKMSRENYEARLDVIKKYGKKFCAFDYMLDSSLEDGLLVPVAHREWWYPMIEPYGE